VKKISNTDFSILKNDFLEICLLKTVISKKTWDHPGAPWGWWWGLGGEWSGGGGIYRAGVSNSE